MALRGGSQGHGLLPGQGDDLRRQRISAHFAQIAKKHKVRVKVVVDEVMKEVLQQLVETTPKDTGAAAGTTVGAKRPLYKTHPAFLEGRSIGNQIGQSGWQIINLNNSKKVAIVNPMWDEYLKEVNYLYSNFVEAAAHTMRNSIAYKLLMSR